MKNKLILLAITLAIGLAGVGIHYRIPVIIAVVLVGLGLFSAASGIQMIVTRKADIPTSESFDPHLERHTGLTAQFWGVLFVMFSVPITAFGVNVWFEGVNPSGAMLERMLRNPIVSGVMIVTTGIGILLYGLTRLLGGKAAFVEIGVRPFERIMSGVYLSVVGSVVMVMGAVRALSPGTLTRLRDAAIAWLLSFAK